MRITRSTLRRLIAEESARLLREAAEEEGQMDEGTGADGNPKMLHVMYRGFRPVFIVTDVDANPLDEEDAVDVTQQIQPAKTNMTTPELAQSIIDFITDESNGIMYVFDEEMNDSETDEKFVTEDYVEHLESLIASGEEEAATRGGEMHKRAVERGEDEDLSEGAFPEEIEGVYGEEPPEFDDEGGPEDDYYGDDDPFGDDEAIEKGYEFDPATAGYKKPQGPEDDYYGDDDPFGDDEALEKGYEYGNGGWIKPGAEAEDDDSWADIETGDDNVPYGAADVALRRGRGHRTDESAGKRHESPRHRLTAYLKKQGADVDAVMNAIDAVIDRHLNPDWGDDPSAPNSEDVTFSLDDSVLDAIPEDDADKWHSMIDAVLADEFDADAAADAAAYRRDIEDTERDLSHPSNFLDLKEGDDSQGEEEEDYGDTDWAAAEVRAGRHAEGPYGGLESDTPEWHRQQRRRGGLPPRAFSDDTSGRGMYFRHSGEDVSMGYTDEEGDSDNLSETRWAKLAGILKG